MYKLLLHRLLSKTSKLPVEEKEKLLNDAGDYFLNKMTSAQAKKIKDAGEVFLNETELIRANFWQEMKDAIFTEEEMKHLDPRSLNYMLDKVMSLDNKIVSYCKDKLDPENKGSEE